MQQPPVTPALATAGFQQDVLLATKLYEPRPQPGFVTRPRLLKLLDEGLMRGLVLVCAPPGSGKTVLVADWARRSRRPVAWLSLDAGDNDPVRFWRHAAAALDGACPGIAERVSGLRGPAAWPNFEFLVPALLNELAAQPGPAALVLDDYHLIDSQPVHTWLAFLLEHLPPTLQLVLISRSAPPLPVARLRARGQLTELGAADLRFTTEEAAVLVREAVGPDIALPDAPLALLATRTEGWAAGLQLAALSLRGQADVTSFVETFSGTHRHVFDYLAEEVLDRQTQDVRDFLLETSILEQLSGPLCDAVTGRTDGQAMLETIERANLFLVALDEVRGWWRYHHLFRDLLRGRLAHERSERVPELHRTAAAWCDRHGLPEEAVRHARAAGDEAWAARLIERHVDGLILRGEQASVKRWVAALPAELVGARPRLLLAQAVMALVGLDVQAVEPALDAAERASSEAPDEPFEPSVGRAASMMTNTPAGIALGRANLAFLLGDAEASIARAREAQALLGPGEWMLEGLTGSLVGAAEWLSGGLPAAERAFASAVERWRSAGEPLAAGWSGHYLAEVQRAQGRPDAAAATYQALLELAAPSGQRPMPVAGVGYVGLADLAYQRDELDAALQQVSEGLGLCRRLPYTQALATGLSILAWIRQAHGDPTGALEAMNEAVRVAPISALTNPVPARRARLLLAQGDVAAAADWAWERGLAAVDEVSYAREQEHLVLVRVLLAEGHPDRALARLERVYAAAVAQGRTRSLIEVQMLRSLTLAARGDEAAPMVLAEALMLGQPQGHVRVFADEGAPMRALLARLFVAPGAPSNVPPEYLARLLRAIDGKRDAAQSTREAAGLAEALTPREQEILQQLSAGRSNQRIAEELVVTVDAVKKHVSRVLAKLGAANRTEAVARARDLGLLR